MSSILILIKASYSICNGTHLLLARWALGPQQPVAQDGAVRKAGWLPANLNGGWRKSQCSQRLHLAGNLD